MDNPLISIIVPVYNTEKYLRDCLNSLTRQTYTNIEIICFNDASTDNSLDILHLYSEKDNRIKVINSLVNVKQGGGRNRAIKASTGEYICFVDSDDFVAPYFVEKLLNAVYSNHAEIATADYYEWKDGETKEISNLGKRNIDSTIQLKKRILLNGCRLWTSIFKRNLIFDNNLFFPEGVIYEDNAIAPALFLSAKKIVKIDDNLYYYRQIQTSTTKIKNDYKFFDRLETSVMAIENIKQLNNYATELKELKNECDWMFIKLYLLGTLFGTLSRFNPIPVESIKSLFEGIKKYNRSWKKNIYYKTHLSAIRRSLVNMIYYFPQFTCFAIGKLNNIKAYIAKL